LSKFSKLRPRCYLSKYTWADIINAYLQTQSLSV